MVDAGPCYLDVLILHKVYALIERINSNRRIMHIYTDRRNRAER